MSNLIENKPDVAAALLRVTLGVLFLAHVGLKIFVLHPRRNGRLLPVDWPPRDPGLSDHRRRTSWAPWL